MMIRLLKVVAFSSLMLSIQLSHAEDTIYTWTDEQAALTNYGDIPPDEELASDRVKVVDIQKGLTNKVEFPTRSIDEQIEKNRQQLKPPAGYTPPATIAAATSPGSTASATAPSTGSVTSAPKMLGSSAPAGTGNDVQPAGQSGMLASGKAGPLVNQEEVEKLSEQENRLEEQAKSARRIAMDKRREEMKALAERVRNGAASRQEISALMTYRQTASFGEARSALARPKTAKKVQLND